MAITAKQKKTLTIVGVVLAILVAIYGAGVFFFSNHFFPNTIIGQNSLSLKSADDFAQYIKDKADNYVLSIEGKGFSLKITKDEAGIAIDENKIAIDACLHQNYWAWPVEILFDHDASDVITTMYDQEALTRILQQAVAAYNETVPASVNATIVYDPDTGSCIVQDEVYGSQIDGTVLLAQVEECIKSLIETCEVTDEDLIKPTILASDERFPAALEKAQGFIGGTIALTLNGSVQAGTVTKDLIGSWLTLDEVLMPGINAEKVQAWADSLAAQLNTVGTKRSYTRADGKAVTVSGGSFGWSVDTNDLAQDVIDHITSANFAAIDIPVSQSANVYNGQGKRDWGAYVDIDLSEQHARYYDASDNLLYECNFVSGLPRDGRATPEGVYFLNDKQSPSTLVGYKPNGEKDYETHVSYWMPFIRNSIGFHDATWQSSFGGDRYKSHGSHGCVNLSLADAKWFYENLPKGTCMITHS